MMIKATITHNYLKIFNRFNFFHKNFLPYLFNLSHLSYLSSLFYVLIFLMMSEVISENALAAVDSAAITAATLKAMPSCLHYRVRGVCYWLSPVGITTTPYLEHYLPDLVVSVFNRPEENPWDEINSTLDTASAPVEKNIISDLSGFSSSSVGYGQHPLSDVHEQGVYFKEADVIGNPALIALPTKIILLPSTALPLLPYYQSMLDAALWRGLPKSPTALAEEAYALVANTKHHIGTGLINWGGIYPHEGKVATSSDANAAAVIAQRASDLITSSNALHLMGHVYQTLPTQCGTACQASPIQENSPETEFQLIYPVQQDHCDYFGKSYSPLINSINTHVKNKEAYVWVVWRFYQGCVQGYGKFIGKTIN